jgi:hypothetical protein
MILVAVIVVLFVVLFWVSGGRGPTPSGNPTPTSTDEGLAEPTISPDGHVEVGAPLPDELVASPAKVAGNVSGGGWFFEASFPVKVVDADGTVLGQGQAQAQADWMSSGTVPFAATIAFTKPHSATGNVVLSKDNPSGDPAQAMSFNVPIRFVPSADASTTEADFRNDSGVRGTMTVGPTCPVESVPPDPACAPKPYMTIITAYPQNSSTSVAMGGPDPFGSYTIILPPGEYILVPKGGNPYPHCAPIETTVVAHAFTALDLSCDSGIR